MIKVVFRRLSAFLCWSLPWAGVAIGCSNTVDQLKFDASGVSRETLEYYLSRSATMAEFLTVDPFCNDGVYPDKERDIKLISDLGVKFVGRAIYRWGDELAFNNPKFLKEAKNLVERVHAHDREVVFQACLFEAITEELDSIPIPEWVFEEYGLSVESRSFRYRDMLNENGKYVDHWEPGHSVPDLSRTETQLWFLFLAGTYINIGCEALHLGQVELIGMDDRDLRQWTEMIQVIRNYASKHARRGWVLIDAHTPSGGMVTDGKSLLDFNSFPMRMKEAPEKPMHAILEKGHLDSFYGRSKGAITPSGWSCTALPYLVEFDNYGVSASPDVADTTAHYVWGYDEITWLYLQDEEYRKGWLKYAYDWLRSTDTNGFLQMPVCRIVTIAANTPVIKCHANTRTSDFPIGMNMESTIKELWSSNGK